MTNDRVLNDRVFVVDGRGDMSVGIWPSHFEVVLKGLPFELTEVDVENIKEFFTEFDDNGTTVYTGEEWDEFLKNQDG